MYFASFIVVLSLILSSCTAMRSSAKSDKIATTKSQEEQEALTPEEALQKLKLGNERFLSAKMHSRDLLAQVAASQKQYPFAVILSCMDSRVSPEIIFDQGIGDIFVERLAGNIVDTDILGGMEFGTKLMGAKLVVVLGHTSCGAVKGACENAELGNLTELLAKIRPAVETVHQREANESCDTITIDKIAEQNVKDAIDNIKRNSPVLTELLDQNKIALVGAMHDIKTGHVHFFEATHNESALR